LLRMKPMLSPPGVGSDFRTHKRRPNGRVRRWASSGYWRWPSPAKAISSGGINFRASALSANPARCEFPCASLMAPPAMPAVEYANDGFPRWSIVATTRLSGGRQFHLPPPHKPLPIRESPA
jgi:hypothetical protein